MTRKLLRAARFAKPCVVAICCIGCSEPGPAFVTAERATFRAVSPEYERYVDADSQLDAAQKARRHRTIETWDMSIRAQESPAEVYDVGR